MIYIVCVDRPANIVIWHTFGAHFSCFVKQTYRGSRKVCWKHATSKYLTASRYADIDDDPRRGKIIL